MARDINELLGNGSVMGKDDQLQKANLNRITMLEAIDLVLDFKMKKIYGQVWLRITVRLKCPKFGTLNYEFVSIYAGRRI
jgi:hypothetical protein